MPLTQNQMDLITTWRLGFFATVLPDGTPNLSPKGTWTVLDRETLGFAEMRSPGTLAGLTHQPVAEVNFVDVLSRMGLRVKGRTTRHPRGSDSYARHLPAFTAHWPELEPAFNEIVTLRADAVRPLASPIYEFGGSEPDLRQAWKARIGAMP